MLLSQILLRLVRQGKKRRQSIHSKNSSRTELQPSSSSISSITYESTLHLLCKRNPSTKRVITLLELDPAVALETDPYKNLPLHVACEFGASPAIIRELICANPESVLKKDVNGMLPIHKACSSYYDKAKRKCSKKAAKKRVVEVIQDLTCFAPDSLIMEDNNEMCPIEHALISGMDIKIIRRLQREKGQVLKSLR